MDSIKFAKIEGYLHCCSDILSMKSIPSCTTFNFVKVGNASDMFLTFKKYFSMLWDDYGVPEGYLGSEQLIEKFNLHFINIGNWQERLTESLDYWIYPLFDSSKLIDEVSTYKVKYIIDSIISLIEDYLECESFKVYIFGKEDEEFIRNSLNYLKSEDYIFRTEGELYLLHLGISV